MNLFKKKSPDPEPSSPIVEVMASPPTSPIYPDVVHEIHNEVYSASDKLLKWAQGILNADVKMNKEKAERLSKLGFTNTPEVLTAENHNKNVDAAKTKSDIVNYYKTKYPLYKIIDEDAIKRVCGKYGLYIGEIGLFTGFVPESKLDEIEKFQIKDEDCAYTESNLAWGGSMHRTFKDYQDHLYEIEDLKSREVLIDIEGRQIEQIRISGYFHRYFSKTPLQIMAPVKDMKISESHRIVGHKIVVKDDPIVLAPLKEEGFYMIVTAWGDEASDPEIVNEINN